MFNSREYEWADITVVLGGRDIPGLRSIRYKESQEKEAVYGKGNRPQAIQKGNKSYEGSIGLLQSEALALAEAAGGSILDVRDAKIVVQYGNPSQGDTIHIKEVFGIEFTEDETNFKQGDKFHDGEYSFIALGVRKVK